MSMDGSKSDGSIQILVVQICSASELNADARIIRQLLFYFELLLGIILRFGFFFIVLEPSLKIMLDEAWFGLKSSDYTAV